MRWVDAARGRVSSAAARAAAVALGALTTTDLVGWEASNAVAGGTARQRRIWDLERLYLGRQYADRAPWEAQPGQLQVIPVRLRKPSTQSGLGEEIVDRYTALAGRPRFAVPDDDDATELLQRLLRASGFGGAWSDAFTLGLCPGSGPLVFSWRFGVPRARIYGPAYCEPVWAETAETAEDLAAATKFGIAPDDLVRLSVRYIDEREEGGQPADVWVREDLTPTAIVRYQELRVVYDTPQTRSDPRAPRPEDWKPDAKRSIEHGWGFVPAEWLRPLGEYGGAVDGPCLLGEPDGPLATLIAEWDLTMSLAGRAAHRNAAPTPFFAGLPIDLLKKFDPAKPFAAPSKDATFKFMESAGEGVVKAHAHADKLKARAYELAQVVVHNPEAGGEPSGEALRLKFMPMIVRVAEWRDEVEPQAERFAEKMLRAALAEAKKGGLAAALLRREGGAAETGRVGADTAAGSPLQPKRTIVQATWAAPIPLTMADRQRAVQTASQARLAQLVPQAEAVRFVAQHAFEDMDAEKALADLEAEGGAERAAYTARAGTAGRPVAAAAGGTAETAASGEAGTTVTTG
jgi:hypothetical protein